MKPFPFQRADLDRLKAEGYVSLLNMEPGAGKTLTATQAAIESGAETKLIIAPLSTHESAWADTVRAITNEEVRLIGTATKAQREALSDLEWGEPGWYITTPQWFTRADISAWNVDMAIVDEVHMLGAPGKAGQRKLSGYKKEDTPLSHRAKYKLALSGTPARNNFERMWSIARFLWPDLTNPDYYAWLNQNMLSEQIVIGRDGWGMPKRATKWTGEREPGKFIAEAPSVLQHFRRTKCCEFHPQGFLSQEEPQVLRRTVTLSKEQKRIIAELEDKYLAWLDEHPLVVEIPLTLQQRIRQVTLGVPEIIPAFDPEDRDEIRFNADCVSPFADELDNILETLDEDEPVVVYLESQRFARALTERLVSKGHSAFEYSGATVKTRSENLKKFGTPEGHRILVGVLSAIGTGTDGIQKVSNTEVWFERSLDMTVNIQAEARLDRLGAKKQVQRYVLTDDHGYADGRFSKEVERRQALAQSLQRAVE